MQKIRKTVSLYINTYNESTKKMRCLGIEDFSQYVDFVLREHSDAVALISAKQRHHQRMLMHYTGLRNKIEEELQTVKRESN